MSLSQLTQAIPDFIRREMTNEYRCYVVISDTPDLNVPINSPEDLFQFQLQLDEIHQAVARFNNQGIVVRHGEIDAKTQIGNEFAVMADNEYDHLISLGGKGLEDAQNAADLIVKSIERSSHKPGTIVIISSALKRTKQTATLLLESFSTRLPFIKTFVRFSRAMRERDSGSDYKGDPDTGYAKVKPDEFKEKLLSEQDIPSEKKDGTPTEGMHSIRTRFSAGLFIEMVSYLETLNIKGLQDLKIHLAKTRFVIVGHGMNMTATFPRLFAFRPQLRLARDQVDYVENSRIFNGEPEYLENPFSIVLGSCINMLKDEDALTKLNSDKGGSGKTLLVEMLESLEKIRKFGGKNTIK